MGKNSFFLIDSKPHNFLLILILGCFFFTTLATSQIIYLDYPYVMDEYNYLVQAKIFSTGHLTIPIKELPISLVDYFFIHHEGHIFSKYPPLFSMILALGVIVGAPIVVNPYICLLFLICLYNIIERHSSKIIAICTLAIVASNPYFLGYASSYFSQPLSLLLTTLAFLIASQIDMRSNQSLYLLGLVLGLHIANRPLDAFCSAIACLYLTFLHRKSYVAILKPLSIMCCGLFILCGYNWVISGKFSFSTYPILNAEFKVIYPEANGLFNGLSLFVAEYKSSLIKNLWPLVTTQYFYYMGVILPLIAVVGLISTLKEKLTVSLILHVFLLLTLYNFHNSQGWPQYGARYYYPTWIGLGVLTAFGLKFLSEKFLFKSDKKTRLLALTSITFLVVSFQIFSQLSFLEKYANRFEFVKLFHRELSKSCNPKDIVAFKYKSWARNVSTSFLGPIDFVRNGNGENDYLFVLNSTDLASAKQSYPERSVCKFAFPKFRLKE